MSEWVENKPCDMGRALGKQIARLCDDALAGKPDNRCDTCAFRAGDHPANGSAATLMTATKCAMEGEPFWCHEHDRACAGWAAMVFPKDARLEAPWPHIEGQDGDE